MAAMQEIIYKGATRPALILDMPMVPALGLSVVALVGGMWAWYLTGHAYWLGLAALLLAPPLAVMRSITRDDDQRVMQLWRRALLNAKHRNRKLWGCRSYSPIVYDGAKDDWMPR
jgi:type IV secretion system protein VirB3